MGNELGLHWLLHLFYWCFHQNFHWSSHHGWWLFAAEAALAADFDDRVLHLVDDFLVAESVDLFVVAVHLHFPHLA